MPSLLFLPKNSIATPSFGFMVSIKAANSIFSNSSPLFPNQLQLILKSFSFKLHSARSLCWGSPPPHGSILSFAIKTVFSSLSTKPSARLRCTKAFKSNPSATLRLLKPLIDSERKVLDDNSVGGKLIVSGFSQGCGMSLHCMYKEPKKVDGVLGIGGYLFPFSPFDPSK